MKNGNAHNGWPVHDWRDHPMFRVAGAPTIIVPAPEQTSAPAPADIESELERRKNDPEGWREYDHQQARQEEMAERRSKVQRRTKR